MFNSDKSSFDSERGSHIISVFGVKGSGKTNWIKYYLYTHPEEKYLIIDHHNEFKPDRETTLIKSIYDLEGFSYINTDMKNKILLQGKIDYNEFWTFAETCKDWTIVFDEIDKCCKPTYIPNGLYNICQFGRHLRVSLISGARRPANVHRDVTSQSDVIIVHHIREPRDLKYIQDFAGEAIAKRAPKLKLGQFMRYPSREDEISFQAITEESGESTTAPGGEL